MCLHTSIFIKTPSLEGLLTKAAKEDPSPPLKINPVFLGLGVIIIIIIIIIIINIIIIIIITIVVVFFLSRFRRNRHKNHVSIIHNKLKWH